MEWEKIQINSTNRPKSRDSNGCCRINNKMYIYGGSIENGDSVADDLWSFDLDNHSWKELE